MQDTNLFEYAVVRIVPRVEREEFMNSGIILYCSKLNFLDAQLSLNEAKLKQFHAELDIAELQKNLNAIKKICAGDALAGPIAKLDLASRFRWLTATRSTVIQCSKVHPGLCIHPEKSLQQLFEQMVC